MAEDGKFRIEKFDGTDFSWWKMQIEDLLVQKDLDVVLGDKPEKMSDADWAGLDRKAMSVIRLSLTKNVAFNILKEKTAKGIMEALSNMYEKPSAANKVFLIRELEVGHFRNQCPNDKKVNIAQGSASDEEVALTCCEESNVDSWVMDSGASFHATHSGEALQNLVFGDFGKVRLADDRALEGHEVKFRDGQWKVVKGNLVMACGRKRGSLYMVELLSEGVTVPVQKKNEVRFTESRGQNKVVCAREKPRATGQTQDERAWKGSRRPVRGICGSGISRGASAKLPRRQWVRRTSIPAVGTSPENFLLSMESVCSQDVPGSGSVRLQWEPVGTEDESGADVAVTDVLELGRASTGLSVV
ncbi:unnamed protein product [Cuscuta campestris]|uniref:Retrovirus-related Pol polyprotein from transposon TNT 1-94 n=1 Tax=Cuscuta campestris TaxID=132261 RepID=A0A484LTA2_9ASTE|nr:unnamed protein product [Cuscuta campestris]